jgi:hypothetical protein
MLESITAAHQRVVARLNLRTERAVASASKIYKSKVLRQVTSAAELLTGKVRLTKYWSRWKDRYHAKLRSSIERTAAQTIHKIANHQLKLRTIATEALHRARAAESELEKLRQQSPILFPAKET